MECAALPPLELRRLGGPEVRIGGAAVAPSLSRAYALLGHLVIEGRPIPRDCLAALMWLEAGPTIGA